MTTEHYFRALIENAADAVTVIDASGAVRYTSPSAERIFGYTPEERYGRRVFDIIHPDDVTMAQAYFERLWEDPEAGVDGVLRARHKSGSWLHIRFRLRNLLADPEVQGIVMNWHDITDQIAAEDRLKAREHFFRSLIERSTDILFVIDAKQQIRYVSPAIEHLLGIRPDEILDTTGLQFVHPEDINAANAFFASLLGDEITGSMMIRAIARGGEIKVFDVRARNLLNDPMFSGIIIDARDITDRQRIEEALRESEERFRKIIETAAEGVAIRDTAGRLTFLNERFAKLFGYEQPNDMIGLNVFDLIVPEHHDLMAESAQRREQTGVAEQLDLEFFRKDGSRFWALLSASPLYDANCTYVGSLGMLTDITERKRLEDQLRQSQKIEAVGRLAGGIAHDFNNLLTAIRGHVDLLLTEMEPGPLRTDIDEIRRAADRAASLTHQLLAFSRRQMLQPRVLELDQVVSEMHVLLRRLIGEDIELITALNSKSARVRADRGQIEQVLMNLVVNARDAMPNGGTLHLETGVVTLGEEFLRANRGSIAGQHVQLCVRDNGTGMAEETLSHVFEPFFTTKAVGKGTGLGLATVYGIVKQSGGYIRVESVPGKGTAFEILLPLVKDATSAAPAAPDMTTADARGETVLIAEDEDAVRSLATRILRKRGYRVLEARHGVEALDIAKQHEGRIDLLLTDVVMPVLGGRELGEHLLEMRPDIKVLFMSGYTGDALLQRGLTHGSSFLEKPFTPDGLALKVREVLEAR